MEELPAYSEAFYLFYKYEYYRKHLTQQFTLLLKITKSLSLTTILDMGFLD